MIRYCILSTDKNLRGREIVNLPEAADAIAAKRSFSVAVVKGLGEVHMRFRDGKWQQKVDSCDRVFGFINGRWHSI